MTISNKNHRIWIALIAVYLIWGSTYLAIRYTVESIPPFAASGIRFSIAGIMLFSWQIAKGEAWPTRRQWRDAAVIGTLLLLGGNGLVSWAEQFVPSGIAALLISTEPIWMVLLEALRPGGEKPRVRTIIGLVLGFSGIVLMIGPSILSDDIGRLNPLGLAALPTAALLWAIGSVYAKSADLPKSTLTATGMEMAAGSISILLFSTLQGEWAHFSPETILPISWIALIYLIVIGSLGGFLSYSYLLQHAPIALASTYAFVNPVIALLLGAVIAQEIVNGRIIVSAAIILGAVILITTDKGKSEQTQAKIADASLLNKNHITKKF